MKGVSHVVNYSVGMNIDMYIHRTGRCGRAGAKGVAYTFVVDGDERHVPELVDILKRNQQEVPYELQNLLTSLKEECVDKDDDADQVRNENRERQKELLEAKRNKNKKLI